ncbi:hypothetical protein [Streptomyces sp. NPDC057877]|uniref:hypothetical protein n=1 Tax=Streptomyces sp. NPDC057877 TaxID=3346269 RepID=UPI0036A4E24D
MTHNETLNVAALGAFFALASLALLIGLGGTAYIALCRALDVAADRRARRAARTHDTLTAAAIDDTVTTALNSACCEPWWTSAGTEHDPACPRQARRAP